MSLMIHEARYLCVGMLYQLSSYPRGRGNRRCWTAGIVFHNIMIAHLEGLNIR